MKRLARTGSVVVGLLLGAGAALWGLDRLDRSYPPPLGEALEYSREVHDRNGTLLRAYATGDGTWRLETSLSKVDRAFVDMLIAYEDRRFRDHGGVDPIAIGRAAAQLLRNGRIVSGGSTLSMQVARLLEPRQFRSIGAKLRQVARAIQIERRLSKDAILELYLNLAPYGGNLEGVRAASLAWFGKEPGKLTVSESALLVALPQLPERRRPDRHPANARDARDRVLHRAEARGLIDGRERQRATAFAVPDARLPLPALAPHASDVAIARNPGARTVSLPLDADIQRGLEAAAREGARRTGRRVSVAIVMADGKSGDIVGRVGSADYFDHPSRGWIDMTSAERSPGSTLKPFIYALALEDGVVMPETLVEDRPSAFGGYRPRNFDLAYQGDVSVREALQLSLNVPAIALLDAIGPNRLAARFERAGAPLSLPPGEAPGLAIGLGGAGTTLEKLVRLYTAFVNAGEMPASGADGLAERARIMSARASWLVTDILRNVVPPEGAQRRPLAYKTGTSYGYRDAWSVGYDGRYVIGVWVGRADGGAVPGLTGYKSAAPILFDAFARSGVASTEFAMAPAGAVRLSQAELPPSLRRFAPRNAPRAAFADPAPEIVYPPAGARIDLGMRSGRAQPLVVKMNGGRAPFRLLANGRPVDNAIRRRVAEWRPDGLGFSTLTLVDAAGRATSVRVFVD